MNHLCRFFWQVTVFALLLVCGVWKSAEAATSLTPNPTSWKTGTVGPGAYAQYYFSRITANHYSICIDITSSSGNADLYGWTTPYPSTTQYGKKSTNAGVDEDCIQIDASKDGSYYISVYGNSSSTTSFGIYVIKDKITQVPDYLQDRLLCPLDDVGELNMCGDTYSETYSHIAAPWGWDAAETTPFYPKTTSINRLHTGVDWYIEPYAEVFAAYGGEIKRIGNSGDDYADNDMCEYIVIEHNINGNYFMTAYLHIWSDFWNWEGENVDQGEYIGETCDMNLGAGEPDHLHFAIKQGAYVEVDTDDLDTTEVWVGAMKYNYWSSNASLFINPDTETNPGLYLYY